jgi:hypothetical protein
MAGKPCNKCVQRSPDFTYVPYLFSSVKRLQMPETKEQSGFRTVNVRNLFPKHDSLQFSLASQQSHKPFRPLFQAGRNG